MVSSLLMVALAGTAISCPATIEDRQLAVPQAGAKAVRYSKGPRPLESMTVFVGHPSKRRSVQPLASSERRSFIWSFDPAQDIWIECSYHQSAAMVIYHVGSANRCTFTRGGLHPNAGGCDAYVP